MNLYKDVFQLLIYYITP